MEIPLPVENPQFIGRLLEVPVSISGNSPSLFITDQVEGEIKVLGLGPWITLAAKK